MYTDHDFDIAKSLSFLVDGKRQNTWGVCAKKILIHKQVYFRPYQVNKLLDKEELVIDNTHAYRKVYLVEDEFEWIPDKD